MATKKPIQKKATTSTKGRKTGTAGEPRARTAAPPDEPTKAPPAAPPAPPRAPTPAPSAEAAATAPPREPAPQRGRDPRTPPVGTVLQKRDRHGAVRCECTVEADGIRYADKLYGSLSGAAMAAARNLGLTNKTFNGWVFWGVTKVARPAGDPVEALTRAWDRYRERAAALAKTTTDAAARAKIAEAIEGHVATLTSLAADVTA
jgi:hypothetical protein